MPRTNEERPKCRGEQPRTTMSSALQDFKGKSNVSMKAAPKKPPEGDASRMGPTWGYSAKLVQGKYVPLRIKCTRQHPDHVNEKRLLDRVTSIIQLTESKE